MIERRVHISQPSTSWATCRRELSAEAGVGSNTASLRIHSGQAFPIENVMDSKWYKELKFAGNQRDILMFKWLSVVQRDICNTVNSKFGLHSAAKLFGPTAAYRKSTRNFLAQYLTFKHDNLKVLRSSLSLGIRNQSAKSTVSWIIITFCVGPTGYSACMTSADSKPGFLRNTTHNNYITPKLANC